MTESDSDIDLSEDSDPTPFPIFSWLAVLLLIAVILNPGLFFGKAADAPKGESVNSPLSTEAFMVKFLWGLQIGGNTSAESLIDKLDPVEKKGDIEKLAIAMVEAVAVNPQAAQKRLEALAARVKETQLEKSFDIVQDWVQRLTKDPKADLTEGSRKELALQLGWFAEIPGNPSPPADKDAEFWIQNPDTFYGGLVRSAIRVGTAVIMALGIFITGMGLLILFAYRASRNELGPGLAYLPDSAAISPILMQTFAIWLVGYFAVSFLFGSLVVPATGMNGLAAGILIQVLSLGALFWPIYRGVPVRVLLEQIGLGRNVGSPREILMGILGTVSFWPVLFFLAFLTAALVQSIPGAEPPQHPLGNKLPNAGRLDWILGFIAAGIMAPIVEEIFFRGLLYRHLREATSDAPHGTAVFFSVGISSVIFAMIHPQGVLALPILGGLGAYFALLREVRNNLTASIVAHAMSNCTTLFLLSFMTNG